MAARKTKPIIDEQTRQGIVAVVMRMLPLILLWAMVAYGVHYCWKNALHDEAYRVSGDTLSLNSDARFCRDAVMETERLARIANGRSLLEPGVLDDVRALYEQSPWIREVCSVKRVFPNKIAVRFVLRSAVAQVRSDNSRYYWLIDEDGRLLPVPGSLSPKKELPQIYGDISRQPRDGELWQDTGVSHALGVMAILRNSPLSDDLMVRKIHVRRSLLDSLRANDRPRLEVETDGQIMIRWGTFNQQNLPDEILSREKIAMLRALLSGSVPKMPGLCLDVRTRAPGYSFPETTGLSSR